MYQPYPAFQRVDIIEGTFDQFDYDKFIFTVKARYPQTVFGLVCPKMYAPDNYEYFVALYATPEGDTLASFGSEPELRVGFLKEIRRINPHLTFTQMRPLTIEEEAKYVGFAALNPALTFALLSFNCFPKPSKQKQLDYETNSNTGTNEGA